MEIGTRRLSQGAIVFLLAAPIYAVYVPCSLLLNIEYKSRQRVPPAGAAVRLGYFRPIDVMSPAGAVWIARRQLYSTVFRWSEDAGEPPQDGARSAHIFLYENDRSLGSPSIEYVSYSKSYSLVFSTSDNSDPRTNGMDYWIVRR